MEKIRTLLLKKNNVCLIISIICLASALCFFLNSLSKYGMEDMLYKSENSFNISPIEYSEVLYYKPFDGGPLGDGDAFIVVHLSERYADIYEQQIKDRENIFSFPMERDIEEVTYNMMSADTVSEPLLVLEQGYYAYYSKIEERFLEKAEILSCGNSMMRFLYMQYDDINQNLYIWEYN